VTGQGEGPAQGKEGASEVPILDDVEERIVAVLKEDPRMSPSQIAERLQMPVSTVYYRVTKLREGGLLRVLMSPIERMAIDNDQRLSRVDADLGDQWRMTATLQRRVTALENEVRKLNNWMHDRIKEEGPKRGQS